MWIFGYGSLIWKAGFEFVERHPGYIEGWSRRFWQASTDHRGVPDAPGRVVTLIPEETERVWGMAYRIDLSISQEILDALDYREKGGYERHRVPVRDHAGELVTEQALVYVARRDNPNWGGPLPESDIAHTIAYSRGPSGPNTEYLFELADAIRAIQADDPHVFELESLVRALLK